MNHVETEMHSLTVIFPAQRWLPELRLTATFTPLGGNLYRLDEGPLCGPLSFHDVIEADKTEEEDVLIFRRRVTKAGLKRDGYLITYAFATRPGFRRLVERINELGGCAEVDLFGGTTSPLKPNTAGVLTVFLPKSCDLDVPAEFDRVRGISKWKRSYLHFTSGLKERLRRYWKTTRRLKTEN